MKLLTTLCITAFAVTISFSSFAQLKNSPYEIGINLGTGLYAGDLTPTLLSPYKSPGLFIGFSAAKKLNSKFSLRADLNLGKVKADDANYSDPEYRKERSFNFKTSVTEFTASIIWNPLGRERIVTPYLFAGAGLSFLKVIRDYSNLNADYFSTDSIIINGLPKDIAHSLPRVIPVLPVGLGVHYSLNKKISLTLQTTYRLMSTDYLDGFSQAADPAKKDHYYTHTIGFVYSFGRKNMLACPK